MKAYKFTKRRHFDQASFRLGTLYDYRREEAYGNAIGDASEGVFGRRHTFDFNTSDALLQQLTSAQDFSLAYKKGEKTDKSAQDRFILDFTSANLLVFSATLVDDDSLFDEFVGTDICLEISDFHAFCAALVATIPRPKEKFVIRECVYGERLVVNDQSPMPSIPFLKDRRYERQKEVRLCVQYHGDPTDPLTVHCAEALRYCKIVKSLT